MVRTGIEARGTAFHGRTRVFATWADAGSNYLQPQTENTIGLAATLSNVSRRLREFFVALSIDGAEVKPQDRFVYKEHLLEDVPNAAWCVGYINASWTLRADLTARAVAKLLAYMDSHGYTHAYPHLGDVPMPEKPAWNINAGYVQRAAHALPKSGTHRPWNVRHNYVLDAIDHRFDRIEESMVFGRVDAKSAQTA